MHGRLLANQQPDGLLRAHAFLYASAYSRQFEATGSVQRCTALQVPSANYPLQRLHQVADCYAGSGNWLAMVDAATASADSGLRFDTPLLRFTSAAIIRTPELCQQLLAHPDIERVSELVPDWPEATTVLACGTACQNFSNAEYLELTGVSGQVDLFRTDNESLRRLPVALVGNGYLAAGHGGLIAGATYEYQPWGQARATTTNRGYLEAFAAAAAGSVEWQQCYRGERCVSSDRTPVAGGLFDELGQLLPGRYVSTGHGSMGTVSAHFCAALIAADIVGDFAPMTAPLRALLSPQRFRSRQRRRGYKYGASN
jgi:tRNA 5-methylaminomethyl-2-thiouridine biosynthesis bifunctional protein